MPPPGLTALKDPNFPDYAYACKPLVDVRSSPKGKKKVARVFLGEWMKIISKPKSGWVRVRFRGGTGYVRTSELSRQRHLEVFFIDVDQGDSILIQTPDDRRILIDGGQTSDAHEFIRNKYRLDKKDNYVDFEAIVATHSDADHTEGLLPILRDPKIAVKRIFHNGLFRNTRKNRDPGRHAKGKVYDLIDDWPPSGFPLKSLMKKFVAASREARKRLGTCLSEMAKLDRWKNRIDFNPDDFVFKRLDTADQYLPTYDKANPYVKMQVLWPRARGKSTGKPYYPWYGDPGYTVNGNSVVLSIQHGKNRILLTGDLNEKSMDDLLRIYGGEASSPLRADIYKAAHHGSQHFSVPFCRGVAPNAGIIMSGDNKNDAHGHPRAVLLGTLTRYSRCEKPAVFCTELAACFRKLPKKEQKLFKSSGAPLYEKSIQGIIHLRSDGRQMVLGTVHGRKTPDDPLANINWKWDVWP